MSRRENRASEKKAKKGLKLIGNILYGILVIVAILLLLVALIQRLSNNAFSLAGYKIFNVITESMLPDYEVRRYTIIKNKRCI